MIGNITIGSNFVNTLHYAAGKTAAKRAELVMSYNLAGQSFQGMGAEMQQLASYSERCQKPVLHISLSFHPDENPSTQRMLEAANTYLEHMGISKHSHQVAIYEHQDTAHHHLHLIINRINLDTAKAYSDSYIRYKNKDVCRKVEQELGLRATPTDSLNTKKAEHPQLSTVKQPSLSFPTWQVRDKDEDRKQARMFVHQEIEKALSLGVNTKEKLALELLKVGIQASWKEDSQGVFVGASFRYQDRALTGNAVGFTAPDLRRHFDELKQRTLKEKPALEVNKSAVSAPQPVQRVQTLRQNPESQPARVEPRKRVAIAPAELQQIAAYANELWKELKKKNQIRYESQAIEAFPFTDLVRGLRAKGVEKEKAFAVIAHFQEFKRGQLAAELAKEQARFKEVSKSYLVLAGKIKGNKDSRALFLEAMHLRREGDRLFAQDHPRLAYQVSSEELRKIDHSPYAESLPIPASFTRSERAILLTALGQGKIEQSYYDLNPKRLKDAFEDEFFQQIAPQLNANYVRKVLSDSPMLFDDKLRYLHQQGILIEAHSGGHYSLGYVGNVGTKELRDRVPASESFTQLLKAHGYTRSDYERAREQLLSTRGQTMITLAQALDTKNAYAQEYLVKTVTRLNEHLREVKDPNALLEALSWKINPDKRIDQAVKAIEQQRMKPLKRRL